MKVVLQSDVALLGQRGDVKDVKPGYARNFLFAQRLAKPATAGTLAEAERLRAAREAEKATADAAFEQALRTVEGKTISITAKITPQGNLYRAISAKQIASALHSAGSGGIEESDIVMEPIKKAGEHAIHLKRGEHAGIFTLHIEPKKE